MEITISDYVISSHSFESDSSGSASYGFMVYDKNGMSLPKGFISSYNAFLYKNDQTGSKEIMIEFGIQ